MIPPLRYSILSLDWIQISVIQLLFPMAQPGIIVDTSLHNRRSWTNQSSTIILSYATPSDPRIGGAIFRSPTPVAPAILMVFGRTHSRVRNGYTYHRQLHAGQSYPSQHPIAANPKHNALFLPSNRNTAFILSTRAGARPLRANHHSRDLRPFQCGAILSLSASLAAGLILHSQTRPRSEGGHREAPLQRVSPAITREVSTLLLRKRRYQIAVRITHMSGQPLS